MKVIIEMEHSTREREILARYQTHSRENHKESTDGKFDDCTNNILKTLVAEGSSNNESDSAESN